jgi:hypothetical protein
MWQSTIPEINLICHHHITELYPREEQMLAVKNK